MIIKNGGEGHGDTGEKQGEALLFCYLSFPREKDSHPQKKHAEKTLGPADIGKMETRIIGKFHKRGKHAITGAGGKDEERIEEFLHRISECTGQLLSSAAFESGESGVSGLSGRWRLKMIKAPFIVGFYPGNIRWKYANPAKNAQYKKYRAAKTDFSTKIHNKF